MTDASRRRAEWPDRRSVGADSPLWSVSQAGFVEHRSCAQQAFALQRCRELARARNEPLFAMFLDLKKAYDSVPVARLMRLIVEKGRVDARLVPVLWASLNNHRRLLDLPDCADGWLSVNRGLPQGAVAAPFLFNIFIDSLSDVLADAVRVNNVGLCALHSSCSTSHLLYADDTALLSRSWSDMRVLLAACERWAADTDMSFAASKSFAMILELPRGASQAAQRRLIRDACSEGDNIRFANAVVERLASFKYLGVHFGQSLLLDKGASLFLQRDRGRWSPRHRGRAETQPP